MSEQRTEERGLEIAAQRTLLRFIGDNKKMLAKVLPKHLNEERWCWLLVHAIRRTPKLCETTPFSFINAVMLANNLGLEIRTNSAYLVPYGKECQLLIDYRGKLELARRAGCGDAVAELVRENDKFVYRFTAAGRELLHEPLIVENGDGRLRAVSEEEHGEVVCGYAMIQLPENHGTQVEVMSLAEMDKIRRRSKHGFGHLSLAEIRATDIEKVPFRQRGPWLTDTDEMFRKTLTHRLCKRIPQTPELVLAQDVDDMADAGKSMPMAQELTDILIDPATDRPMIETTDKEGQQALAEEKIARLSRGDEPTQEEMDAVLAASLKKEGQLK